MISNLMRLKKMMVDKPWLYEEEEHAVVKLAEDALALIRDIANQPQDAAARCQHWIIDREG